MIMQEFLDNVREKAGEKFADDPICGFDYLMGVIEGLAFRINQHEGGKDDKSN